MIIEEDKLVHYGTPRHSGRYPWGSGGEENARNRDLLGQIEELRKQGMSQTEIAKYMGMTTTQLRAEKSIALNAQRAALQAQAQKLKDTGMGDTAIAREMGLPNESSVRALLEPGAKDRVNILHNVINVIQKAVDEKEIIDVGIGNERYLNIARTKFNTAIAYLENHGYKVHYIREPQLGVPGNFTTIKVLTKDTMSYPEVFKRRGQVQLITEHFEDGGRTVRGLEPIKSLDSKRLSIRYAEQGGKDADGVIYVRPGVPDVNLGNSRYAQVRIAVDGTHYLKGMAMYKDGLPKGIDVEFNTSKSDTGNKYDAMKPLKDDKDNPFGSTIARQSGVMNVLGSPLKPHEEGNWSEWSRSLSSQILSKQSPSLAKSQLDMTYEAKKNELDQIMQLTNPAVRRRLLESFADDADSSAVHLKAAILPRTANHVILPISNIKEDQIYAPNYRNGERVVLIRHPHGGKFEIPELTVNNRNAEAKASIGNAKDAVGIHPKVAQRLSGADFDGDTVLVIPNNSRKIKTAPALEGLKNFDPQSSYKPYDGMRTIDGGTYYAATRKVDYGNKTPNPRNKQVEMGKVSNLITDMTIRGASNAELARAVRHSMVVIDSEKHSLDFRRSELDNGIKELKTKYQGGPRAGAYTLISKARSEVHVTQRKPGKQAFKIDPATGRKVPVLTGNTPYYDKRGKLVEPKTKSTKLAETPDAHTLSSGTHIEGIYADHSNRLKALANTARKESVATRNTPTSDSAKRIYSKQVASLNAKLNIALKNAPLERQAQILANAVVRAKKQDDPDMDKDTLKKIKFQTLQEMRNRTGAARHLVNISPDEWEAIQAGAVTSNMLKSIIDHADLDVVKKLATPRSALLMTSAKINRAQAMLNAGYTQSEVADHLGVSLTTLKTALG